MLDAMLDIFGDILGPKVGGGMDKMASWANTGRFYVWTRSSLMNFGQVDVWTGSVGREDFFFFQNVGSAVQKYSNLAHGKFQNSNQPEDDPCTATLTLSIFPTLFEAVENRKNGLRSIVVVIYTKLTC